MRWCSAGCNIMRQWDLTRAVPRHVRDVKLVKGDILGIATRRGFVYTCGADGSIRCVNSLLVPHLRFVEVFLWGSLEPSPTETSLSCAHQDFQMLFCALVSAGRWPHAG